MRKFLAGLLLIGLAANIIPAHAQPDRASEVIRLVNELRASHGLPSYRVDATLIAIAQAQAEWSAANNHIGHDGPGGSMPMDRALAGGYGAGKSIFIRENAAHGTIGYNTPELVVTMWQSDDVHLETLVSASHDDIGVGYAEAGDNSWYVMMVGRVGAGKAATSRPQSKETLAMSGAPAVPFALNTPGPDGSIRHEVQAGQTAWTVAAYYGIGLQELLAMNNLTEASVLRPGDVLLIRPPAAPTLIPLTLTPAQIAVMPTREQASTVMPALSSSSAASETGSSSTILWVLLAAAVAVLVGSAARAAYILRQPKDPKGFQNP